MFARKKSLSKDEKKSLIVLTNISLTITIWLCFKYFTDPQQFITEYLGLRADTFTDFASWALTLLIAIGYITYTVLIIPFVRKNLLTISWLKIFGIWVGLTSSTVEEVFFRQRLMDWLNDLNFPITLQVLASAVIFGLAHSTWGLLRGETRIILPVVLSTTLLGGALAILYLFTERSILAPIVAHVLINLFIEPWLILAAISGKWE